MQQPLHEPDFLQGRTSVVERAVRISLMLALVTALVIVVFGIPIFVCGVLLLGPNSRSPYPWLAAFSSVAFALHIPFHTWNQRTEFWGMYSLAVLSAASCGVGLWLDSLPWLAELEVIAAMAMMVAASGVPLLRSRREHILAYLVSIVCIVLPGVYFEAVHRAPSGSLRPAFAYIPEPVYGFLLGFGVFCSLAIPWGIPFWWPPEQTRPDLTQSPGQPPTAP